MLLPRRPVGDHDVLIKMKYCGVCHSDLHTAADHLPFKTNYPCVPGHELAGVCVAVGKSVTKVAVGQRVGVGCVVDSCLSCKNCKKGEEQMCSRKMGCTGTYNDKDKHGRAGTPQKYTLGGYTNLFVIHEHFAILIPESFPLEYAGPVMCAGITLYDPLKKHGATAGTRVGIVGVGGLGQMGLRLAKVLGCEVTAISRTTAKRRLSAACLGLDAAAAAAGEAAGEAGTATAPWFLMSSSPKELAARAGSLDLILNTVPSYHNYDVYTKLLAPGGKQVLLGLHKGIGAAMIVSALTRGRSKVKASGIGGIRATQEVMDLCAEHDIKPEIKVVPVRELNEVYERLDAGNATGIRYVLDLENTLTSQPEVAEACRDTSPPALAKPKHAFSICGILGDACRLCCCCKWC